MDGGIFENERQGVWKDGIKVGFRGRGKFTAGLQYSSGLYFILLLWLPDIMDNIRYDQNQICSESKNFCGYFTFSFAFIAFVVPGR